MRIFFITIFAVLFVNSSVGFSKTSENQVVCKEHFTGFEYDYEAEQPYEGEVLAFKKFGDPESASEVMFFDKTLPRFRYESFEGDPDYDCKIGLCYSVRTYENKSEVYLDVFKMRGGQSMENKFIYETLTVTTMFSADLSGENKSVFPGFLVCNEQLPKHFPLDKPVVFYVDWFK